MFRTILTGLICLALTGCGTLSHPRSKPEIAPLLATTPQTAEDKAGWVNTETKKIWVNEHVDENGDLVEGHYKYVVTTPGHWSTDAESGKQK